MKRREAISASRVRISSLLNPCFSIASLCEGERQKKKKTIQFHEDAATYVTAATESGGFIVLVTALNFSLKSFRLG
jgi:predicted chitinase